MGNEITEEIVLRILLILLIIAPSVPAAAIDTTGTEVLVNGSFEQWEADRPVGWTVSFGATEGDGNGPESMLRPGGDAGAGNHSLSLSGDSGTQKWYMATQRIDVTPGEIFYFSGWIRSDDVRPDGHRYHNSQIALQAKSENGQRVNMWILGPATGTTEWTQYDTYLQAPLGSATLEVMVFLSMSGTLEFDDISLKRFPAPVVEPNAPRDDRWRTDVDYLAEYLPKLHVNPFTIMSEVDFRARAAAVEAAVGDLDDLQMNLQLMALVASLGDAHTSISFAGRPRPLPIQFQFFGNDLRVLAVDKNCADLAGGRVTHLGGHDMEDVLARVRPMIACETESWFISQSPRMLRLAEILYGLGISETEGEVAVTVIAETGATVSCTVKLPQPGQRLEFETREPPKNKRPLYLSSPANYWFLYLEDSRTLYLQYNRCREDQKRSMSDFTQAVAAALDTNPIDKFVLDLRHNSGGSSTLLDPLIQLVAERKQAGGIKQCYVITGPATFSAAALNTLDFRRATGALVVGQPMGNKPNRFGQLNVFTLPYSGLQVQYATKHFVRMEGDPPVLAPDIEVRMTWSHYMAGQDPVMDRILEFE